MNILLIGESYSNNIGDQAVSESTKWILEQESRTNFVCSILDLSGRREIPTMNIQNKESKHSICRMILSRFSYIDFLIKSIFSYKLPNYFKSCITTNIDCAVFCGGQLINSSFIYQMNTITGILSKNRIPVIYSGVGIGRLNIWQKRMFNRMLNYKNVVGITCRCDSKRFNETLRLKSLKARESFDPAIFTPLVYNISRKKSDVVGLGIMRSSRFTDLEASKFWLSIILELESRNIKWKMFYTGSLDDYELAISILSKLGLSNEKNNYINKEINTPRDFLNEISYFDRLISFRLHSHILAFALGIPSVAIKWDEKITDFFKKVNRTDSVFTLSSNAKDIVDSVLSNQYYHDQEIEELRNNTKNEIVNLILDNVCKTH